ncbi:MAG: site-specific integrase [Bacilli bacterium]|nr:site-specific integrase [Bacilli bacterium]
MKKPKNIKRKDNDVTNEEWKKQMNNLDLATRTKNDLFKYLKSVLNFGSKWYDFNFNSMYNKMTNFNNPNEMPKEMEFWTYEEFNKFISVEGDIKFKALYETLYYCGCRSGEVRGITWKDIDFKNKELSINKNIIENIDGNKFLVSTPKTKSSIREIPIPDKLIDDLIKLKVIQKSIFGFTEEWYVFGSFEPLGKSVMRDRKNNNCKLAGVKQIRIHDFRHSCASLLINNGANITMVAKYLGHTKIDETLNTYAHMFKNKLGEIVDTINNL